MNFDSLMSQLRKEYVESLPEKIQTIRHFLNSDDHRGVKEVFHKLKGTGATYGVPEISTIGETLEAFVQSHPQSLKDAVPDAIDLLEQIHTSRLADRPFNLQTDHRFLRILQKVPRTF